MNAPLNMTVTASLVDLSDDRLARRIEEFVSEERGSLFHLPQWLKAAERASGHRASGFITEQMGAITGWVPLTEVRSLLFGQALVSSGFGVGGGILAESDDAARVLARAVENYAQIYGFASAEMRGGPVPPGWKAVSDKHCGFARDLAQDDEAELLAIPRKARAEVRKGLKNGLEVRIGRSSQDIAAHFAVYSESVRNLGTPVFPKRLFRAMLDAFPESSDILTVVQDGVPISSVLSFYHNGAVLPFWGGGKHCSRDARANELMYYELMLHARRMGMSSFDFGRSKTDSGPYRFKKNWGFDPEPLTYSTWTAPGEEARDIDPTSDAYASKIAVWKKLPLAVANRLGPLIARDLA
ncbi:FemAB [Erythrobacter sp. KY5]|uniref:FemAB family XrtA/PEP-CTERM system-associated protein n=1 Tax=Erythrobacter sp. KY5 TaxID=2011159 RepID=UPI000DBF0971|nr:FemAB family XrtA/PEP-CTERM system-associated protein [Erythrobacter sp. KY5]AWW74895.1 FemAB [Erythrobacter sp. KY5]